MRMGGRKDEDNMKICIRLSAGLKVDKATGPMSVT